VISVFNINEVNELYKNKNLLSSYVFTRLFTENRGVFYGLGALPEKRPESSEALQKTPGGMNTSFLNDMLNSLDWDSLLARNELGEPVVLGTRLPFSSLQPDLIESVFTEDTSPDNNSFIGSFSLSQNSSDGLDIVMNQSVSDSMSCTYSTEIIDKFSIIDTLPDFDLDCELGMSQSLTFNFGMDSVIQNGLDLSPDGYLAARYALPSTFIVFRTTVVRNETDSGVFLSMRAEF